MRADLMAVADWQNTLKTLATRIDKQYHQTNQRILAGDNPHIGSISLGIAESELESTVNGYFTLDNIHSANDQVVQFMDGLALPEVYRQQDGPLHTSSDGLKFEVAEDCLHARYSFKYFGADSGRPAWRVRRDDKPSRHARRWHREGASTYTFIDMRNFLYHSLIISAAEHEAHYVIDGLMHNDVVKSDIHSTDTGGYSEILFGVMNYRFAASLRSAHLLGFAFAPRMPKGSERMAPRKNFAKCKLYAFNKRKAYQQQGYKILPDAYIKAEPIASQWDEILRFMARCYSAKREAFRAATIKLKEETASQLFKRLNSYSRQHPLYSALKEFGKIPKTDFLVVSIRFALNPSRYIDILQLRQMVEKQLNKGENANAVPSLRRPSAKFSRAVSFGNNAEGVRSFGRIAPRQEFLSGEKVEQEIAEGCSRLIKNAIT